MDYNAYEILGLSADATRDEIDARYKELRENISATDFFRRGRRRSFRKIAASGSRLPRYLVFHG